jgi:hypothetical protein
MKTYKLSVPEPCKQDWDAMTPDAQGRFCSMCAKSVIDFTGMSDQQISQVVLAGNGKVCGRFKNEQLERFVIQVPQQVLFSQTHFHKAFLLALLVAMGTTLFSCTDHNGTSKPIDDVVVVDSLPNEKEQQVILIDIPEDTSRLPILHPLHTVGKAVYEPVEVNLSLFSKLWEKLWLLLTVYSRH